MKRQELSMTMPLYEKRLLDREALRSVIQQWNANRLDLFELSEPTENLEFHGVMRFYFQDVGQKVATKCIRVASDATVSDVIETLIEKFRPDMRMLSVPNYALYEVHANGEERKLNPDEKPLLVQLNWHVDDREGRFLLKDLDQKPMSLENTEGNFKRKLSKREKKEQKKKEKQQKLSPNSDDLENHLAEKLYTDLPETSFTRSISNPEAVMRRRRQQKLEKKLQQFRARDGGPDTGGTLKIYGESLCRDVPYKTLLLSIRDCAQAVVREMLTKYGMDRGIGGALQYCLVQVNSDGSEYILDDDECPLSILMNHPTSRGSIMFHVRRRPADVNQTRRRKKKPLGVGNGGGSMTAEREGPMLIEITHSGDGGRRLKLTTEPIEVGSANTNVLQLFGPSIQPRHCLISLHEGICTVTPLHVDGLTFVNGHHITQPTVLHNGSVVMFGRAASYRFVDVPSDGRYNLALSQSQLDSAYLYENNINRSSTNPPTWQDEEETSTVSLNSSKKQQHTLPQQLPTPTASQQQAAHSQTQPGPGSNELTSNSKLMFENDNRNVENETKSVSSLRSQDSHQFFAKPSSNSISVTPTSEPQGQEAILPAVLEFPEHHQEKFLRLIITDLDVNSPNFKLAPVYTLYLCARYRASTHYRPDLQPTERAHKLTDFLHHVANLIHNVIQGKYNDPKILSFWMANSSEFLHFLKCDRHISAFSVQAQEVLAESVQSAFQNLVTIFHFELSQTLNQFLSENIDHDSAAGLVLSVLGSAMALFRRCRVNAALTIQLFSQLFHYINAVCFNKFVTTSHMCTVTWGKALSDRLGILELWAEKQGLELAADCHLAKINQCAEFLQKPKTNVTEVQKLACSCFRLNSLQMGALLSQETIPRALIDATVRMAESVADELARADGREICLEESPDLPLALLLPVDGFSCDHVNGIPAGLHDFLSTYQNAQMCRLAPQPTSIGLWTVYMHHFNGRSPSANSRTPEVQTIKLNKNTNGMGLSIVAAKGAGQDRLGIYIKSVVCGGAADADGRLQAGDQLLRVDGQNLIGITQERAADFLVRTGPVVTLEVAKQGAIFHGLATLLQQPSPIIERGSRRMSERDANRVGNDPQGTPGPQLSSSKSVPTLHHIGNNDKKSRSFHNLNSSNNSTGNIQAVDQGFYQNLSVYYHQNQSQPNLGENNASNHQMLPPLSHQIGDNDTPTADMINRPASSYFNTSNGYKVMTQSQSKHATSTHSTDNLVQSLYPAAQAHFSNISHPNLSATPKSAAHKASNFSPTFPNQMISHESVENFIREGVPHHSMKMRQQEVSNAGFVNNFPENRSMQNLNQMSGNLLSFHQQSQQQEIPLEIIQNPESSPNLQHFHQTALLKESYSLDEMKALKRLQQVTNVNPPFANSMENIRIPTANQMMPIAQNFHNLVPQKQRYPMDESQQPPLPPSSTHPLFRTPVASNSLAQQNLIKEVPKNRFHQNQQLQQKENKGAMTNSCVNPWEREEREKRNEVKRQLWRDQQIAELSLLSSKTPQQEEQLKNLVLEKDFERRAKEEENEEEYDVQFQKNPEDLKEIFRLQSASVNGSLSQTTASVTLNSEPDVKMTSVNSSKSTESTQIPHESCQSSAPLVQPKGILKSSNAYNSNPSSPSKNSKVTSFAPKTQNLTEITVSNTNANQMLTQLTKEMGAITMEYPPEERNEAMPPPPPERGSSFSIMHQQKFKNAGSFPKLQFNDHLMMTNNPKNNAPLSNIINENLVPDKNSVPSAVSPQIQQLNLINNNVIFARENKRVSFHDYGNNNVEFTNEQESSMLHQDQNPFIEESSPQLYSPGSETNWNLHKQSTPGVIGAQEVYRDPRQRRLAEQQLKKPDAPIPEKLTFKEKMKMFALESGENTPKDKLKISRAQRDIDAVH